MLPVAPETRAEIERLITEGKLGRNAIARETGVSGALVTSIAKELGHVFDWRTTELAVRAHAIQAAEIRAGLHLAALLRAHEALEAMDSPHLMVHYQAATEHEDGGWKEHVIPGPTPSDQRNLATVFGIMVSKAQELGRAAAGVANADAVSQIEALAASLSAAAEVMAAEDPTKAPVVLDRESLLAEYADAADEADAMEEAGDDLAP